MYDKQHNPEELMLMMLKNATENELSFTGITSLAKMMNIVCGTNVLPQTRYALDKYCGADNKHTLHATCPICFKYLGKFEDLKENGIVDCSICNIPVDCLNASNPCYFAIIDPSASIREILQENDEYYDDLLRNHSRENDCFTDIYDGVEYKNFLNTLNEEDKQAYATLSFNTDGAPVFQSSKGSIRPIYLMPNEIPIEKRRKNVTVCGLWFGPGKPDMKVFLDIFVDDMNDLSENGIKCNIKN